MNVCDLRKVLGLPDLSSDTDSVNEMKQNSTEESNIQPNSLMCNNSGMRHFRVRRQSMEQLDLIKVFVWFLVFFFSFLFYDSLCCSLSVIVVVLLFVIFLLN